MSINNLHKLASGGDNLAENELFQKLSDSFFIFAQQRIRNRAEIEEIVQDALMTISVKYKDVDFEISFSAWAYRVLENKLLSHYRTKTGREKKIRQLSDELRSSPTWNPDPGLRIKLQECLKKVGEYSNRYARVINLSYHGYGVEEICDRLKSSRQNMYNLLSRARRMLRTCLEKGVIK